MEMRSGGRRGRRAGPPRGPLLSRGGLCEGGSTGASSWPASCNAGGVYAQRRLYSDCRRSDSQGGITADSVNSKSEFEARDLLERVTSLTTFREYLGTNPPNETGLKAYLGSVHEEDWCAEFKLAATATSDFQIRKAVASLANHEGGELFLGVSDQDRSLVGTAVDKDSFYRKLAQPGAAGDWYALDLAPLAVQTTEVPLDASGGRVLAVEIRKALLPALVVGDDGARIWYERRGRSDHVLTGPEGVEARRRYTRGRLLRELFIEFDSKARSIPNASNWGSPIGRTYFSLPRFESARADGSLYSDLTEDDLTLLLAGRADAQGRRPPGMLPRYIATGERLDLEIGRFNASGRRDWEAGPGSQIRVEAEAAKREAAQFETYVRQLGIVQTRVL